MNSNRMYSFLIKCPFEGWELSLFRNQIVFQRPCSVLFEVTQRLWMSLHSFELMNDPL